MKKQKFNLPEQKTFRQDLRKGMTSAEVVLWKMLKGRQIEGIKFRRQFGVGPYVLDFYSPTLRLGIELDGLVHFSEDGFVYDRQRTSYLWNEHRIRIIRFENKQVFEDPDLILDRIRQIKVEHEKDTSFEC